MTLMVMLKDRQMQVVLTGCALMAALAWAAMLSFAPMLEGLVCGQAALGIVAPAGGDERVLSLIAMWACMMVAMLLPVAVLGLLRGDAVRALSGRSALAFLCGYLGVALSLAVGAAMLEWALEILGWIGAGSRVMDPALRGILLIIAALHPVLRWMGRTGGCSANVVSSRSSWSAGLVRGYASIGCCLSMIAIQFAVGAMNAAWMASLALWMLLESVPAWRDRLASFSAIGLLTAGSLSLVGAVT